uniref:pectate lyase family protein n=1 Tax=Bacillus swezeyi TaxID=1925020 RepID=UPI00384C354D
MNLNKNAWFIISFLFAASIYFVFDTTYASAADEHYPKQRIRLESSSGLNITPLGDQDNAPLTTKQTSGEKEERWRLDTSDGKQFKIRNMKNGKIIIPAHYALSDNNPAVVYYDNSRKEELWNIIGADKDGNGDFITYKIVSALNNNLALTLDGSGVKLAKYTSSSLQKWKLPSDGLEGFGGYAKETSGRQKTGTTGGLLGNVVYVNNLAELKANIEDTTPRTVVVSNNISTSAKTVLTVGANKTIVGSFEKHKLNNIYFKTNASSGNIIFKNLTIAHDQSIRENNDIPVYITDSRNYWIDHVTFQGHSYSENGPDVDKLLYVGAKADYVTLSHSKFTDHKYGLILGWPEDDQQYHNIYDGYPRMTISHNYFDNLYVRAPGLMRYGYFHVKNNYINNFHLGFTITTKAKIYSEANYFGAGSEKGGILDDYGDGLFKDVGSYPAIKGQKSAETSWNPSSNYSYRAMKAGNAKAFAERYAGAQRSALYYANFSHFKNN